MATIAHELFHASQFSYDNDESAWLYESTAAWGEFRILQKLGRGLEPPHGYLPSFFFPLKPLSLADVVGDHEYGAYLYSLFAQMEKGDAIVRSFWEEASAQGRQGLTAINRKFPFHDNFREFALRNWNQEPVSLRYEKADKDFPNYNPLLLRDSVLEPNLKETLTIELPLLAAGYYKFTVADVVAGLSDTKKVRIFLGNITGQTEAGVDAIVTIAGEEPEVRYWSDEPEIIFCLTEPDQRLQELILIVSNARIPRTEADIYSQIFKGQIEIEPSTEACSGWIGTITQTITDEEEIFEEGEGWTRTEQHIITTKLQVQVEGSTTTGTGGNIENLEGYATSSGHDTFSSYEYYSGEDTGPCPPPWYTSIFVGDGAGPVEGQLTFIGEEDFRLQFFTTPEATGTRVVEGQESGCVPPYSFTDPDSIRVVLWGTYIEDKYDPNNPNVLEGSKTELPTEIEGEGITHTVKIITTWSLRRY